LHDSGYSETETLMIVGVNGRKQKMHMDRLSTQANPQVVHRAFKSLTKMLGEVNGDTLRSAQYEQLKNTLQQVHRNKQKAKYVQIHTCKPSPRCHSIEKSGGMCLLNR
jgi:hypothetical protein